MLEVTHLVLFSWLPSFSALPRTSDSQNSAEHAADPDLWGMIEGNGNFKLRLEL